MEILLRWTGAQLVGLALTTALIVRDLVHGSAIRFPAFCLLFLLIVYALVYGIALMTIPFAMANLFAGYPVFFYGFIILLLATLVLSLTYVIRLEITALRH